MLTPFVVIYTFGLDHPLKGRYVRVEGCDQRCCDALFDRVFVGPPAGRYALAEFVYGRQVAQMICLVVMRCPETSPHGVDAAVTLDDLTPQLRGEMDRAAAVAKDLLSRMAAGNTEPV